MEYIIIEKLVEANMLWRINRQRRLDRVAAIESEDTIALRRLKRYIGAITDSESENYRTLINSCSVSLRHSWISCSM